MKRKQEIEKAEQRDQGKQKRLGKYRREKLKGIARKENLKRGEQGKIAKREQGKI